jgi:AraC-like DNA-binding protein
MLLLRRTMAMPGAAREVHFLLRDGLRAYALRTRGVVVEKRLFAGTGLAHPTTPRHAIQIVLAGRMRLAHGGRSAWLAPGDVSLQPGGFQDERWEGDPHFEAVVVEWAPAWGDRTVDAWTTGRLDRPTLARVAAWGAALAAAPFAAAPFAAVPFAAPFTAASSAAAPFAAAPFAVAPLAAAPFAAALFERAAREPGAAHAASPRAGKGATHAVSPRAGTGAAHAAALLAALADAGLPLRRAEPAELAAPLPAAAHDLASAMSASLSNLQGRPMMIDLEHRLARSARQLRRAVAAFHRYYDFPGGTSWHRILHWWRLSMATSLMTAPTATTERVAATLGYGSPRAFCLAMAQAGLPSPGRIARTVADLR